MKKAIVLWLFIGSTALMCRATTVVVIVVPEGIVLAADGKSTLIKVARDVQTGSGTSMKVFVSGRVGIGIVGFSGKQGSPDYFFTWITDIMAGLKPETSVDEFASTIGYKSREIVSRFNLLQSPTKQEDPTLICQALSHYIVVGYAGQSPKVYAIALDIDWDKETTVGPRKILLHPAWGVRSDYGAYFFGQKDALLSITDASSFAYKYAVARLSLETNKFVAKQNLTLDETINLV
jgi:hypothetical protein